VKMQTPTGNVPNTEGGQHFNECKDIQIGSKLVERYEVLRKLSKNTISETVWVMDEKLNKVWVVKIYDKHLKGYYPSLGDAISCEAHTLMKYDHPSIQKIAEVIETDDNIYVLMEYVEGQNLEELICNEGVVSEETAIIWAKQLCDALNYLHKQNPSYICWNLKPENIMLQPCNNVKIIGSWATKANEMLQDLDACGVGVLGYFAPEGYKRGDARADIFSLGMIIYYLLTGVNPYASSCEIRPIREFDPQLSHQLENILVRCTRPNPDERFQSCEELMMALEGNPVFPQKKPGLFNKLFGKK